MLQSYFLTRQTNSSFLSKPASPISLWLICQNSTISKQLASTDSSAVVLADATIFNPHIDGFKEVSKHQGCNPKTIHSIFQQLRRHQFIVSASTDNYRGRQAMAGNREFYFIRPSSTIIPTLSSVPLTAPTQSTVAGVWNRKVLRHLDQIGECAKDGMVRYDLANRDRCDEKNNHASMNIIVSCIIDFVTRQSEIDTRWLHLVCPYNLRRSMREEVEKVNKLMHQLSPLPTCLITSTLNYHLEYFLSFV